MVSVKNPNKTSRNRMAARAATKRKQQKKMSADGSHADKVAKADTKRGARAGLLPTSGPRAPLSAKKQKKVVQRMALALKRKMEANGGVLEELVENDEEPKAEAVEEMETN